MRIWICGVRGSTPAPGHDFLRYGGHTSCLAIGHDDEPPSLILDAGTGIRRVGDLFGQWPGLLGGKPFDGSIVLAHLHWDHVQGLPFFGAANDKGALVTLYLPNQGDAESVLGGIMSPPYFPIGPSGLAGSWTFLALDPGEVEIEGFSVLALEIPHSAGRTFGLRISDGTSSIAYLSDHCPTNLGPGPEGLGAYHEAATTLAQDVDVLFHDGQYSDDELPAKMSFGHAAVGYAVGLAREASVERLVLFHHDPARSDDEIDATVSAYSDSGVAISAAAEGMLIELPSGNVSRFI